MSNWRRTALYLILIGALLLRVGWCLSRSASPEALAVLPDQLEYLEAGQSILSGEGLRFTDGRFEQQILASRTIGYPLFVAGCGGRVRIVQFAQCLIDVSTVMAVYLIARRWLSTGRSLFAAAVVALNPLLVYFCALVLTETLYVAALTWSIYLVISLRTVGWAVLLAALSVHIRPSALLMPMVLAAWAGWVHASGGRRRLLSALTGLLCGGVMLLAVLAPWAARNRQAVGEWVWLTTNGGITLYDGVHPGATGASDQSFVGTMPELSLMDEVQRDALLRQLAREQIRRDPVRIARLAVIKTARTWSPVPLSDQFSSNRIYILAGLFYTVPLFVLAAWGLVRSRLGRGARVLLIAPAVVITLMHAVSVGSMRYRLPAEPMLGVLAASVYWRAAKEKLPSPTSDC